jgi:hypothetical protein
MKKDIKKSNSLNFTLLCQNNKTHKTQVCTTTKTKQKEKRNGVFMFKFGHVDVLQ